MRGRGGHCQCYETVEIGGLGALAVLRNGRDYRDLGTVGLMKRSRLST